MRKRRDVNRFSVADYFGDGRWSSGRWNVKRG